MGWLPWLRRKGVLRRMAAAVRRTPRALREDLWTVDRDPLPPMGAPDWPVWRPVLVFAVLLAALVVGGVGANHLVVTYRLGRLGVLLGLVQAAALVAALYRPVPAWWMATGSMAAAALLHESPTGARVLYPWTGPGIAAQAGVLLLLALRVRPRAAISALSVSVLIGAALALPPTGIHRYDSDLDLAVPVLATAVLVGAALRGRRVARTQLVVQEELTTEERTRRTLLEERNRIARELHDVVAHHMSVISIQAQVAPHLVENPPPELRENLAGIREHAVEALTELRRVLGVLRSEDARSDGTRHAPQPTLDRLDELVGKVRAAGLAVAVETRGERRPLPPGVELSAFRIVQEALSNVLRHAPGASARVRVDYRRAGVAIRVANTAPALAAAPSPGMGHGVLGMRERTAMLGGEFAAGPTPLGGYEVVAMLPVGLEDD
ncbi:sensor histidine kinase [Streptomyces palmae]|uniref:histidine kinase n=2 Tax=Streptomyces palmae TaxID=1701085 RepID=A0A4Z0GCV4_9ACTN|nr:sensor histidine kinase [Streptomyces palmae]